MKIRLPLALAALLALASTTRAQTQFQFPNSPWQAFAPNELQCGTLLGANFNSTLDQAISISVPSGLWAIDQISISNPSVSMTTAAGGFYSAASKGGVTVVANTQAYTSLTTNAANTTGNYMQPTLSTAGNTTAFAGLAQTGQIKALYLSLTTSQGAPATADVRIYCHALYP